MSKATIGSVKIDSVIKATDDYPAEITEKNIEKGGVISDHVERKPPSLSLVAVILDPGADKRISTLRSYQMNGNRVMVQGLRKKYTGMVIENINLNNEAKISNGYEVNISLKQVRIIEAKRAIVEVGEIPEGLGGANKRTDTGGIDARKKKADKRTIDAIKKYQKEIKKDPSKKLPGDVISGMPSKPSTGAGGSSSSGGGSGAGGSGGGGPR